MRGAEWIVASGLALVLLIAVLTGWGRSRASVRRCAVLAGFCLALLIPLLLVAFKPAQVPTGWITVLMEGPSIRNIQQLYGQGAHAGPGFHFLIDRLTGGDASTLRGVAHLNVVLAVINTALFLFLALYVLDPWWAAPVFAWGYASNLNTLHAAVSETPAMLWTTHFWLGCIAAAALDDEAHAPASVRRLALACLTVLAVLAALLRFEFLVLGGPAVALAAVRVFGGEPWLRRCARAAGRLLRSLLAGPWPVFAAVAAALAALEFVPWPGTTWGWVAAGIRPFNFSFLNLPVFLSVFLPFGFVLLFLLGMVHAVRRWLSFLLLPVSLLVLFKVYASAAHGVFFERFRYLTFLTPVAMFIALFGPRELSDWARRLAWPAWWKRTALVLLAMSLTVFQAPGPKEFFRRRQQLPGVESTELFLGWNQQTEARYLLDLIARYPACTFLAKTTQAMWTADPQTGYQWVVFGSAVPYREAPDSGAGLERAAEELAPGAPCVLFYQSLDCNRSGSDPCREEIRGRAALEERVFENLPYSDIREYGAHRPEIHLGVYPIVGTVGERRAAAPGG